MNSVFPSFIFSLFSSIQVFTFMRQFCKAEIVVCSAFLSSALKDLFREWSSANPFKPTSSGTTSCNVKAYAEYRFGPARLPCGTKQSRDLIVENFIPTFTLQNFGHRYDSNQASALPNTLNLDCRTWRRIWWSTVSNATLKSIMHIAHNSWFSKFHSTSFTTLIMEVSQLKFFLYTDWYSGINLWVSQYVRIVPELPSPELWRETLNCSQVCSY